MLLPSKLYVASCNFYSTMVPSSLLHHALGQVEFTEDVRPYCNCLHQSYIVCLQMLLPSGLYEAATYMHLIATTLQHHPCMSDHIAIVCTKVTLYACRCFCHRGCTWQHATSTWLWSPWYPSQQQPASGKPFTVILRLCQRCNKGKTMLSVVDLFILESLFETLCDNATLDTMPTIYDLEAK